MRVEILFLRGAREGQRVALEAPEVIRLGRHPDNDVVFDPQRDLDASGRHAEIFEEQGRLWLRDVGSANGTFINDQRVSRQQLNPGDEISCGAAGPRIRMLYQTRTAQPAGASVSPAPESSSSARPEAPASGASSSPPSSATPGGAPAAPVTSGAHAPQPPRAPSGPGADGRVGARTVAMMIDLALHKARQERPGGVGRSTVFLRSVMSQAVRRGTRRFKVISIILVATLLGVIGGLLALRHYERKEARHEQEQLRQDMARLMERQELAPAAEKGLLAERLGQMNQRLTGATSGKEIVQRSSGAIFLMAYQQGRDRPKGFCTAFAVRERVLATNAHCVLAYQKYQREKKRLFVVMNRHGDKTFKIQRAIQHPRYRKPSQTISEDVGLLVLDARLTDRLELALRPDLEQLSAGDLMYSYGFPGRLAYVASPDATLVQGVIGRITRLSGALGSFADNQLIQHSAFTSGGTSGSPIFNQQGRVIAINAGGYVEPGSLQVLDPSTGRANKLMVTKQLAGYNFGIRIDALESMLDRLKEK